jgi:hypothetical protein
MKIDAILTAVEKFVKLAEEYNAPRKGMKSRWSVKYKKKINCNNPKGFSQKNYCKRKRRGGAYKKASAGKLIIVDIQAEYKKNIGFNINALLNKALEYSEVLILWNGPELGMCSENQLKDFYLENFDYDEDLFEEFLSRATFFDKGYGFFRDLMDHPCFIEDDVIKIAKYMINKNIRDIRELSPEDISMLGVKDLLVEDLESYGFYIPDLKDVITKWDGADLAGGSITECLAEVEILSKALNLQFSRLNNFTY